MSSLQAILIIYGIAGFVLLWILMGHLGACISGWQRLAKRFRTSSPFSGHEIRLWHAKMNTFVNYGNVLYMGTDAEGFHLRLNALFRIGHPPLFIPWSEVQIYPSMKTYFSLPVPASSSEKTRESHG